MGFENIIFQFVLIFSGAAILATLFLYLKQPVMLSYIILGMLVGPFGLAIIGDSAQIGELSHIGVILLLFLLGMNLKPERLIHLFSTTAIVTVLTSVVFLLVITTVVYLGRFSLQESLVVGAALMFSSTIVSLKLIPTTTLHHKHMGEMMTSVLLMQDVLAILLILVMTGRQQDDVSVTVVLLLLKLVVISLLAVFFVRFVINRLFLRFDVIQEYAFILSLGWGLSGAGVADYIGLSYDMGAFIAGVAFASSPVAMPIAEVLKPLRDFFLVLFFFSIGAQFNFLVSSQVLITGGLVAGVVVLVKAYVFRRGFELIGEKSGLSRELGIRLGQGSEFALLIAYSALSSGLIGETVAYLIQIIVIMTFIFSTYWVVLRYRTPISGSP